MGRQPSLPPALMHPTLLPRPFHHEGWVYEEKIDGYRMVAVKANGAVQLISRQGREHTKRFPQLVKALGGLKSETFMLDGEVAVFDRDLISRFEWLRGCPDDQLQAVFVVGDPLTFRHRKRIHELEATRNVPTFVPAPEYLDGPRLMAYGPRLTDMLRQAAVYVDKILKGAKPADLPVEQPTNYKMIINLKTAKALGLTIPPSLLQRADQVIE